MRKIVFLLVLWFLASCTQFGSVESRKIIIGFSQCTTGDDWRKTMIEEMRREIGFHPNYDIELIITDAQDNSEKQIRDIHELMNSGIDLLIVSPNEAAPLTPIVGEIYDRSFPVIVIDRRINSEKFTSYIGGDNFVIGKEAALFANQLLNGKGKILEITGLVGSTPSLLRALGFFDGLEDFPEIEVVKTLEGAWLKERAQELTDTLFYSWTDFDLIFAHNDQMAYGAYLSTKEHNLKPFILGVDGLAVPGGGIDMVLDGSLDGTFLYPTGGDQALDLALKVFEEKPYSKLNYLKTIKIDFQNARTFKLMANQLMDHKKRMDRQHDQMGEMSFLLKKQGTIIFLITIITGLLILLVGLSGFFLYQKSKSNRILFQKRKMIQDKNKRITVQRDKLLRALKLAEEATEAKAKFFTNVSHEIRTVLSLISLPIHQLSSTSGGLQEGKVQLLKKSVNQLLSLSEEILDNRKINYHLNYQTSDLAACLLNIVKVFEEKAIEKRLTLNTKIPAQLNADYDPGVIEKIMFNLISNALKYTHEGGKIEIKALTKNDNIQVSVEDKGIGILEEDLPFIFDRFYRGKTIKLSHDESGSGIGLALTQELVQLHGGEIKVESKLNEGSTFAFSIPRRHILATQSDQKRNHDIGELQKDLIKTAKKKKILLVEDHDELRAMMGDMLIKYFSVIMAKNGQEAMELAKELQPDIIVSDILMPVMDGFELCGELKNNPSTFHIPVVLLTAIDSEKSSIKSFEAGADAYLSKPCNEKLLLSRIQNLIESREKLKDKYGKSLFPFGELKTKEKSDKDFINGCLEEIYQEASNPEFNLVYLAHNQGMSRSSLYRRIKGLTGLKPVDFMKKAKLQYAAKLLLNHDLTIYEIAWNSGFADPKYFSKVFAEEFGDLPSRFKNHLSEETIETKVPI